MTQEELMEELKKLSAKDKLRLLLDEDEDEQPTRQAFGAVDDSQKQESDVISAKAQHQGLRIGHAPETLTAKEFEGLTENDRMDITIRHSDLPTPVVSNVALIEMMGIQTEDTNRVLYEKNEIDEAQYWRNRSATIFAKSGLRSVVNALSAVEGKRQGSLERNLMSGKLAHENLAAEAEKKKTSRMARLKAWAAGERN